MSRTFLWISVAISTAAGLVCGWAALSAVEREDTPGLIIFAVLFAINMALATNDTLFLLRKDAR